MYGTPVFPGNYGGAADLDPDNFFSSFGVSSPPKPNSQPPPPPPQAQQYFKPQSAYCDQPDSNAAHQAPVAAPAASTAYAWRLANCDYRVDDNEDNASGEAGGGDWNDIDLDAESRGGGGGGVFFFSSSSGGGGSSGNGMDEEDEVDDDGEGSSDGVQSDTDSQIAGGEQPPHQVYQPNASAAAVNTTNEDTTATHQQQDYPDSNYDRLQNMEQPEDNGESRSTPPPVMGSQEHWQFDEVPSDSQSAPPELFANSAIEQSSFLPTPANQAYQLPAVQSAASGHSLTNSLFQQSAPSLAGYLFQPSATIPP
uniref:Uncharacterized protein n=1 Tax=Macrostomum lignano TaxID=282301 RepID=A0A1I8F2D1_9PLAT